MEEIEGDLGKVYWSYLVFNPQIPQATSQNGTGNFSKRNKQLFKMEQPTSRNGRGNFSEKNGQLLKTERSTSQNRTVNFSEPCRSCSQNDTGLLHRMAQVNFSDQHRSTSHTTSHTTSQITSQQLLGQLLKASTGRLPTPHKFYYKNLLPL